LGGIGRIRLVRPEGLHVTLCFLGLRVGRQVPGIAAACREAARGASVRLSLGGVLWLPPRRPRTVGIGLLDEAGALGRLQAELSEALGAGGWYEPEHRPFNPHITVGRLGRDRRLERAELPPPAPLSFTAEAVTLYRSHTDPGGARYEALEQITLAPPPPP
jgi:2'-5' RNA ligase